ncbi:MAG: glycosidase [Candidatus Micrarchaeota archaeon]|nr:glycosidase [Candidatus Micrarchaeota archaeon]MDE1849708.1 glycosidase [Candidatus Micrarchaeota archaeon]
MGEVDREHERASDKDGALFPERINGEYKMLRRPWPNIEIASSKELSGPWTTETEGFMTPRKGMWDNGWVGGGAPPILTDNGWFILYHGADTDKVYRLGAALVEKDNPAKVLWRSEKPLLEPKLEWEINGVVSNVVFACAAIERNGNLWVWYGGADSAIGAARL